MSKCVNETAHHTCDVLRWISVTPAIALLEQQRIAFEILQYDHDSSTTDFGQEAIDKLGLSANKVFKTLLVDIGEKEFVVAVVSMNKQLCLKRVAKACKVKKAVMADKQKAQTATGYLLGGISPLGQKKRLKTLIDEQATQYDAIYVSAGKRGVEIKINPDDLCNLLSARYCQL